EHFAKGAICILHMLCVEKLVFGTEEMLDYQKIADIYVYKSEEMENFVKNLPDNLSYPQKTQDMWQEFAALNFTGDTPNH
ncbi:nucleotidyltransferase family protein, partial [Streptococcus suis]